MARNYKTPAELAEAIGVSKETIVRWIRDGEVYAIKAGPFSRSPYRIPLDEYRRVVKLYSVNGKA